MDKYSLLTACTRLFFAAVFLAIGVIIGGYLALWCSSNTLNQANAYTDRALCAHNAQPLDCNTLVVQRWETADGREVMPPQLVPLWSYIQTPDQANAMALHEFKLAFERDLHNGDASFHETHENIDGHERGDE